MKVITVGEIKNYREKLDKMFDVVTELDSAEQIDRADLSDAYLLIAHDSLHTFVGHWDIFDSLSDDRIGILVWGELFRLSEEQQIIDRIEHLRQRGEWQTVKSANQALISFDFIKRRTRPNGLPNYMQIETTSYCNARCVMCIHYYEGNAGAKNIDKEFLDNISRELCCCYVVAINGMGEPFVHPDIEEIIQGYANRSISLFANTNLSVMTPSLVKLIDDNFLCLEISCDGATKESFESIRKNLSFDSFLKNMQALKDGCKKLQRNINMVIMRKNIHEMCMMVELAKSYGISFVSFSNLQPNPVIGDESECMYNYPAVLNYYCQQAYARARELGVAISCPIPEGEVITRDENIDREERQMLEDLSLRKVISTEEMRKRAAAVENEHFLDVYPSDVPCVGICEWALDRVYINLDGDSSICCCRRLFTMGKIDKENPLEKIWKGEKYQKIRSIFYSGRLPNCCINCGLLDTRRIKYLKILDVDKLHQESEFKKNIRHRLDESFG